MKRFDAAVIGGGILGCFAARNLRRWNISTVLMEQEDDVCKGITRANSAIVYAGYDNKPGSVKAAMTVGGNAHMEALCRELEVPFSRCGSLLVTYEADSADRLEKKYQNGIQNGVPGLRLLTGAEAEAMEPMLRPGVAKALYAPSTGTVNPWLLGIAAYENAMQNGAVSSLNTQVLEIRKRDEGYEIKTNQGTILCKMILNCAGLYADKIQELLFPPSVRLHWDSADYLVLDAMAEKPGRVIFHQARSCGKGITAIPCVEGNLLISGVRKPLRTPFATTPEGLQELHGAAKALLPEVDLGAVIRSFGAVRPNPYREDGESLHDFCIENPAPGFYSLIGIKTPGLTCANELGFCLAEKAAGYLRAEKNPNFDPCRKSIPPLPGKMICQCEMITEGQIREAIRRGASTVDGVKRRVGSGMGRCQGSRCTLAIEKILEECQNGTL
ncbi:MAG: NAD(P)/FAD-dependent oxidoreductase [Oscillospiraceae bacterium]|nr:NAD(P)/FAD-dependent oxidoreductase [Oscillospiraceae bacterium]MBQ7129420.1 NAD(P)/FAD-dependent oxidoreductase [Oscillospiraceae bacterium]